MNTAVVGLGPVGQALAAHLSSMGHTVRALEVAGGTVAAVRERGGVTARGALEGSYELERVSTEPGEVMEGAEVVFVCTPAHLHRGLAEQLAPFLGHRPLIFLCPGRTLGAVEFAGRLAGCGVDCGPVVEAQTVLHTCRLAGRALVHVLAVKRSVQVAVFPASEAGDPRLKRVLELFPQFKLAEHVGHTSWHNIGSVLHPVPALMNAGRTETVGASYRHYIDGVTPSVARVLSELDRERQAVAGAHGVSVPSLADWLMASYGSNSGHDLRSALHANPHYQLIDAPDSLDHRYINEDVPTGLVPLATFGKAAGIATPVASAIVELASVACGTDFLATGRTPERLGLSGLSPDEVTGRLKNGPAPKIDR
jgi:opine dehydrogenase